MHFIDTLLNVANFQELVLIKKKKKKGIFHVANQCLSGKKRFSSQNHVFQINSNWKLKNKKNTTKSQKNLYLSVIIRVCVCTACFRWKNSILATPLKTAFYLSL